MGFESRNGKRKLRSELTNRRKPELGYYLIVTDTEGTERVYFNGLRDSIKDVVGDKLIIKVVETKNRNMIKEAKEFLAELPQYAEPWIVFDKDKNVKFDKIIEDAENSGVTYGAGVADDAYSVGIAASSYSSTVSSVVRFAFGF